MERQTQARSREVKTCPKCRVTKSKHEFWKSQGWCKDCQRAYARSYHKKRYSLDPEYRERIRQSSRNYYDRLREAPQAS